MSFFRYLKTKRKGFIAAGAAAVLLIGSFGLYRLPVEAVAYPLALCAMFGIGWLILDYLRIRKKHNVLARFRKGAADRSDGLPEAETLLEEDCRRIIGDLEEEIAELRAVSAEQYREMIDYYTVWAHQIKTPIASMKLALQNEDSELSRRLGADLFRTQQYVDMVMAFLRLGSDASDYVFRACPLDGILRASVKKFAPEFIGRRLSLDYEPTGVTLVTDEKWFGFVVEQLLSNALKYTREGGIHIGLEDGKALVIADTGIGISPEDLPRIFEKGYTGYNGRTDLSASGLGLYLCRRVCEKLGLGIRMESEVGIGTTVRLDLPRDSARPE